MAAHFDGKRPRTQPMAEEAGVEPTEDAWRPPTGLKPARVTGPDTLPSPDFIDLFTSVKVHFCSVLQIHARGFAKFRSAPVPVTSPPHLRGAGDRHPRNTGSPSPTTYDRAARQSSAGRHRDLRACCRRYGATHETSIPCRFYPRPRAAE